VPGRTAQDAVEAYLEPIRQALGCLDAVVKVVRTGGRALNQDGAWVANGGSGILLPRVGALHLKQKFRVVEVDPRQHDIAAGRLRVTTLSYNYKLEDGDGHELWMMHWHPDSPSTFTNPHLHLKGHPGHRPTPRQTVEDAVKWAQLDGAPVRRTDWQAVLALTEGPHKLYRTWSVTPDEPHG